MDMWEAPYLLQTPMQGLSFDSAELPKALPVVFEQQEELTCHFAQSSDVGYHGFDSKEPLGSLWFFSEHSKGF